jgi:hypothetical protein
MKCQQVKKTLRPLRCETGGSLCILRKLFKPLLKFVKLFPSFKKKSGENKEAMGKTANKNDIKNKTY